MAEPSVGAPVVAVSERDVLLATKLHVPRPQPGFVPRLRLAAALDEGLARQLVLVPGCCGRSAARKQ
jgi:LuxR family transcriptional regulator, maltose regulon positive regulatory protein